MTNCLEWALLVLTAATSLPSWLQANWLKSQGVGKGDRVSIYMPMVCQLPIAMVSLAELCSLFFPPSM